MINSLQAIITNSPLLAVFIVFWAGFISSLSSCTIIRIPVVFGYVSGASDSKKKSFLLSLCLVSGLIFSYTCLGMALILLKNITSGLVHISRYIYTILGIVLLVMGLFYSGLIRTRVKHSSCEIKSKTGKRSFAGAFIFGAMFGFLEMPACPCCASVLFVIVGIVGLLDSWSYSLVIFFSFAIGQSFPILLIGSSAGLVKHLASKVARVERYVQFVAGNILLAIALFFLILA